MLALPLADKVKQEGLMMPNENPAAEYLTEAREALVLASTPEEVDQAQRAHAEALMLHALAEQLAG